MGVLLVERSTKAKAEPVSVTLNRRSLPKGCVYFSSELRRIQKSIWRFCKAKNVSD
jgi:hypothetical protein